MSWEKSYDSKGFDEAQAKYDISPLLDYSGRTGSPEGYKVYISKLQRTYDTAKQVFQYSSPVTVIDLDKEILEKGFPTRTDKDSIEVTDKLYSTALLNEVPKRSYKDTGNMIGRSIWVARSRIQWYLNNRRQPEIKKETIERAEKIVDILEQEGRDCVLISHEFFLYTLKGVLEKRGFLIERSSTGRIKNWERIRASRRDMHCGVCGHNCLLNNPGCNVGRDAAERQGIKIKR